MDSIQACFFSWPGKILNKQHCQWYFFTPQVTACNEPRSMIWPRCIFLTFFPRVMYISIQVNNVCDFAKSHSFSVIRSDLFCPVFVVVSSIPAILFFFLTDLNPNDYTIYEPHFTMCKSFKYEILFLYGPETNEVPHYCRILRSFCRILMKTADFLF